MAKPNKALIKKELTVHIYSELWHASDCVLKKGISDSKASSWQFLSSIMLTAFSFEAFLNHAGEQVFSSWNELERLPPLGKFSLLCEKFKVDISRGNRPRSTIFELFAFRDSIAHGKTKHLSKSETRDVNDQLDAYLGERLLIDWQSSIRTSDFALRAREDAEKVMTLLHNARPQPKEALFAFGMGTHSASLIGED